jgi:hypothetical protein
MVSRMSSCAGARGCKVWRIFETVKGDRMLNGALKGFLIIGLAFSFILLENIGCIAKKRVKPHADTVQSQQIPQADKRGTLDAPFIVKSIPAEKSQQESDEDARDKDDKRWNDRATLGIAFFTLFILCVQTIVFGLQAFRLNQTIKTMDRLGKDQSRDMRLSIAVSDKAAEAAKQSAQIAKEELFKLQRAFLSVQRFRFLSHLNLPTQKIWWSFHVDWVNSGVTPTRNLRFYVARYLESVDIPATFKFEIPPQVERPPIFLGPKATMSSTEIGINGDDLVAVQNGGKFLYLWGRADYRDIFDNTPDHVTKFFVRVGLRGDPTKAWDQNTNLVEMIFVGQNRHNCADEECESQI